MLTNIANLTLFAALRERVRAEVESFHKDEDGLSTIEMMLILLVGVLVLAFLISYFWDDVWSVIQQLIENILGETGPA
jgi:hypothetical protein